jgi:menaquinone-dependent protoporphyrinogen oxidase
MDMKILVAYATKYGATGEIADKVGEVLQGAGLQVDVSSVDRVQDLAPYGAVVLGSAVYIAKWRKEAVKFLKENQEALAERLVWLFSSGPLGEGNPVELLDGWRFPASLQPIAGRIQPRDIAVFHGHLKPEKLNFLEKWMLKNIQSPVGDFRDWEAITSWAESIAAELKDIGPSGA